MAHILVVDDVADYCDELATGLSLDGHSVLTAHDPAYAIYLGSSIRPDVLVTDWLLQSHIYGLDVSEAIRIVKSNVQTVLITGFATIDLYQQANEFGVTNFLEKPFPLARIREAVKTAIRMPSVVGTDAPVGILELDERGAVSYQNDYAQRMFARLNFNLSVRNLKDMLRIEVSGEFPAARHKWLEFHVPSAEFGLWQVRTRPLFPGRELIVLIDAENKGWKNSSLVARLLGLPEEDLGWGHVEVDGHVLVVDDSETIRMLARSILAELNVVCHTAQTLEEALRLFVHDSEIHHVVLDYEIGDTTPEQFVGQMQYLRPNTHIVGTSGGAFANRFAQMEVKEFLPKPWLADELVEILRSP